jgi:pilus assembly protein CpaB
MLELAKVPSALAPKMIFSDPKELVGRVTTQTIPQGTPVVPTLLAPKGTPAGMTARIKDGYRAVAVKVDEVVGVAGWVKPGCRVDVVAVMTGRRGSESETISKVILQNVEVLAVGQDIGTSGETAAAVAKTVTLLVRPDAVTRLHLASTKGTVRLAMRNQSDGDDSRVAQTTDNEIFTGEKPKKAGTSGGAGLLGQLFGKQPKPAPKATDKEPAAPKPVVVAAAPAPPQWSVEVLSGSKSYNVVFDGEGADARRVDGGAKAATRTQTTPVAPAAPRTIGTPNRSRSLQSGSDDPAADMELKPGKTGNAPPTE